LSFYEGRRVAIAGASGLIGSHVAEALVARGANVVGTLHRSPPVVGHPRIEYRRVDLSTREGCDAAVKGCEDVILSAANTSGAYIMKTNPVAHVTENLLINAQVIEAAWRAGVERLLFVSTTTVYPAVDYPVKEEEGFTGDPHPAYFGVGWMKRYIEKLCAFYTQKFGMKFAILRPTNVYGPRDKFDFDRSHVLPALIRRALESKDTLEVWGDGTAVRDFVYIDDTVDAIVHALEHCADGEPINVGSGEPVTVRESVELILRVIGREDLRVVYDPTKPTTIPKRIIDLTRARAKLGWAPKVKLEEGLRRTIAWWREQGQRGTSS
jgi:GDP-L-fucose synthase